MTDNATTPFYGEPPNRPDLLGTLKDLVGRAARWMARTLVRITLSRAVYLLVLVFLYAGTAAFVTSAWVNKHKNIAAQTRRYAYTEPRRPYVYRVLVPQIVKQTVRIVPRSSRNATAKRLLEAHPRLKRFADRYKCRPEFLAEFAVLLLIQFCSVLGFVLVLRRFFDSLYRAPPLARELVPVLGALMALAMFWFAGYIYDLPQLFLFTAGLYALRQQRWRWFYPIALLGFLNKETTSLMVIVTAVYLYRRVPARQALFHVALQIALVVVGRYAVLHFVDPGTVYTEFNTPIRDYLAKNLVSLAKWNKLNSFPGQVTLLFIAAMVFRSWSARPLFLRRAALLVVPFLAAFLQGGLWREIRVVGEVYPVMFLLFYEGLLDLMGVRLEVVSDQADPTPIWGDNVLLQRLFWATAMLGLGVLFFASVYMVHYE